MTGGARAPDPAEPTLAEIAPYLRMGRAVPEGELAGRVKLLLFEAPLRPRGAWTPDGDRFLLCGTVGAEFDAWQRRLAVTSATDALIAQAIGTAAVEKVMDGLEEEIRGMLRHGRTLKPRWSPGYGDVPLEMSREILGKLDAARRLGVSLTDSLTLVPTKSVTAVCELVSEEDSQW